MKELVFCTRCESVGRKSRKNANNIVIGPNGIRTVVCDKCLDEIDEERKIKYFVYEIKEDEGTS